VAHDDRRDPFQHHERLGDAELDAGDLDLSRELVDLDAVDDQLIL